MSSAILYVAIVAIWAAVLMPRWLRPRTAATDGMDGEATGPVDATEPTIDEETETGEEPLMVEVMDPVWVETASPWSTDAPSPWNADAAWERIDEQARRDEHATAELSARREASRDAPADKRDAAPQPREHPARPRAHERAPLPASVRAQQRARVLRARRRMLVTLLLLTAVAAGLAFMHLAALWVVVPPAGVLGGFLILLREASHSDAQNLRRARAARAEQRARTERDNEQAEAAEPAARTAPAVPVTRAEQETVYVVRKPAPPKPAPRRDLEPTAQVIPISARLRGEVYDQYTDAAHRAVGD